MLYNKVQIEEILPHRYPFLLIDRIEEINETNQTIIGTKCVTANEYFFQGHFPNYPVMPGVLIVEALAQTGAVYLLSQSENKGKLALFAGINKVRFKKQVIPGDVLTLTVTMIRQKASIGVAKVEAKVGEQLACQGEILFALQ